jgi:hypothetical protein
VYDNKKDVLKFVQQYIPSGPNPSMAFVTSSLLPSPWGFVPGFVAVKDGVGYITVGTVSTKCNINQKSFGLKILGLPTGDNTKDISQQLMNLAKEQATVHIYKDRSDMYIYVYTAYIRCTREEQCTKQYD